MKFKYVGSGANPPKQTLFMGVAPFTLGGECEVTDPHVLAKIKNHRCFEEVIPTPSTAVGTNDERDACTAKLLDAGVTVNTRWGLPRLRKEVQKLGRNETRNS